MYHKISLKLEFYARRALNLKNRGAMNGVIDADYIDKVGNAFTVLIASVAPYYKDGSPDEIQQIGGFLKKFRYLDNHELNEEKYFSGVKESAEELRKLIDKLEK